MIHEHIVGASRRETLRSCCFVCDLLKRAVRIDHGPFKTCLYPPHFRPGERGCPNSWSSGNREILLAGLTGARRPLTTPIHLDDAFRALATSFEADGESKSVRRMSGGELPAWSPKRLFVPAICLELWEVILVVFTSNKSFRSLYPVPPSVRTDPNF